MKMMRDIVLNMNKEKCGYCKREFDYDHWQQTEKCKHCGEFLDNPPYLIYNDIKIKLDDVAIQEVLEKDVSEFGNSGHVIIGQKHIGKKCIVIIKK